MKNPYSNPTIERVFSLNPSDQSIDVDKRTVELAFSSDKPLDRGFGIEILEHSSESVRMGFLSDGGALLVNHNDDDQVGVVEDVRIDDGDGMGRSLVRFGNSQRAAEIFDDVQNGIRRKVSVRAKVHNFETSRNEDGRDVFRVTDWEPLEVSIVSVPADRSVGIGRSHDVGEKAMSEKDTETTDAGHDDQPKSTTTEVTRSVTPTITSNESDIDVARRERQAREAGGKQALDRVERLLTIGEQYSKYGGQDLARQIIKDGGTPNDLNEKILERMTSTPEKSMASTQIGMTDKEVKEYSLFRALDAVCERNWDKYAPFELEVSRAAAESQEGGQRGDFVIPSDVLLRSTWLSRSVQRMRYQNMIQREMGIGAGVGGELIGTDHLGDSWIVNLRANSVLMSNGAMVLTGLQGNVDIPRVTTSHVFGWSDEDTAATPSDLGTDQVTMAPKENKATTIMRRKLLKQSDPSVEAVSRNDMVVGAALSADLAGLSGSGVGEVPEGITVATGVSTVTITTAGQPTWAEIVEFASDVAASNALRGSLAFVTTAQVWGHTLSQTKDAGSGQFLSDGNIMVGYPIAISTQLAANTIIFGNMNDAMFGMWGGLDILVDDKTLSTQGAIRVTAIQDMDFKLRHPESYAKNV